MLRSKRLHRCERLAAFCRRLDKIPGRSSEGQICDHMTIDDELPTTYGQLIHDVTPEFRSTKADTRDGGDRSVGLSHARPKKRRVKTSMTDAGVSSNFDSLDISPVIVRWLNDRKITAMTGVQKLVIPRFLRSGNDVLVQSQTGSGKTLCFVVPMLDSFLRTMHDRIENCIAAVFSVIMLPTRELATQVHSVVSDAVNHICGNNEDYKDAHKVHAGLFACLVLIGGYSVDHDVRVITKLKETNGARPFIIATPGRLRHLMDMLHKEMVWTFKEVSMLVLDEADRLLEMGYQNDMTTIMGNLPKQRKTGFFSATLPMEVVTFANRILKSYDFINADIHPDANGRGALDSTATDTNITTTEDPDPVAPTAYATPTSLHNFYLVLDTREKLHFVILFLIHLKEMGVGKCVIFFLTCSIVDYFSHILEACFNTATPGDVPSNNILLYKIHRKMPTSKRQQNLNRFRSPPDGVQGGSGSARDSHRLQVLLCTDVFSRGIDIPQIEWVVQYDAPQDPNFYVHRIGRASRAGASGNSLLLLNTNEEAYVQFQLNRKIPLQPVGAELINTVRGYYQLPDRFKALLPHDGFTGSTTVANGHSYVNYLESTEPEETLLPWPKTCQLLSFVRSQLAGDRTLLLSASRAFVSYTRAYSEHRLSSIFVERKLDYGGLATSFGVLRVPRVKEILGRKLSNFSNSDIDPRTVAFKDEKLERERLKGLEKATLEVKERPVKKKPEEVPKIQRTRTEKRNAKRENVLREWQELSREESLVKKLRRRKITRQQYERLLNNQEDEESIDSDGSEPSQGTANDQEDTSDWEAELDNFVKEWQNKKVPPKPVRRR
ncbi:DEAD/DEAH box domain containing protein [Babesia divergens]|uniref:ATP-dependent RNA helicase n=1 Tax=Babesia divergens TaxID=32595 RepID=A0AAD9G7K8_BABDI|nr:DEAD/DEAH box domain containing protein [Babesia divergens]